MNHRQLAQVLRENAPDVDGSRVLVALREKLGRYIEEVGKYIGMY